MDNKEIKPVTMTVEETALYIGILYWLLLDMAKRNEIPVIRCGRRKLFRKETIDKWMTNQETLIIESDNYGQLRKIK